MEQHHKHADVPQDYWTWEDDMPQDYWAWGDDGTLVPLGICDGFDEAFERAETKCPCSHWVFSRQGLEEFKVEILRELP